MFFVFDSLPDRYKTQEMCSRVNSGGPFSIVQYPDITRKTIKKPFTALYADEKILCFNEDFLNLVFICNEMGILNIDLNNINLD